MLQERKAKPSGRVLAESNILTCNDPRETGSTFVAICVASPSGKDLEALGPYLAAKEYVKVLPRLLACLRLSMSVSALCKADCGIRSRSAAAAR